MVGKLLDHCDAVEECYEFMLAYAAQGLSSDESNPRLRQLLHRAAEALHELTESCTTVSEHEGFEPVERYLAFLAVVKRDAADSIAAIELVLAQPIISSQLIDNLNASIHLRALLTDLFLFDEILRTHTSVKTAALLSASAHGRD